MPEVTTSLPVANVTVLLDRILVDSDPNWASGDNWGEIEVVLDLVNVPEDLSVFDASNKSATVPAYLVTDYPLKRKLGGAVDADGDEVHETDALITLSDNVLLMRLRPNIDGAGSGRSMMPDVTMYQVTIWTYTENNVGTKRFGPVQFVLDADTYADGDVVDLFDLLPPPSVTPLLTAWQEAVRAAIAADQTIVTDQITAPILPIGFGPTASRPATPAVGYFWMDTDKGYGTHHLGGDVWVDGNGNIVV